MIYQGIADLLLQVKTTKEQLLIKLWNKQQMQNDEP
jgi:hypothetical protein